MSDIESLIKRLELASGPDRALDLDISHYGKQKFAHEGKGIGWPPHYTASIDAALTLVPEGYAIQGMEIWAQETHLTILETQKKNDGLYWHTSGEGRWKANHAIPSIALCIAALRARLELANSESSQ